MESFDDAPNPKRENAAPASFPEGGPIASPLPESDLNKHEHINNQHAHPSFDASPPLGERPAMMAESPPAAMSQFPSNSELLNTFNRRETESEETIARNLRDGLYDTVGRMDGDFVVPKPNLLDIQRKADEIRKEIGQISEPDREKLGRFGEDLTKKNWADLDTIVKSFKDNPDGLDKFFDYMQLELERRGLFENPYSISLTPGTKSETFGVFDHKSETSYDFPTDGKYKVESFHPD